MIGEHLISHHIQTVSFMSIPLPNFSSKDRDKTRPKHDVAEVLRRYLPSFLAKYKLSTQQFKAVKAILACRTSALGGHHRECDNGDCLHVDQSYNSCGNRHCPKCQGIAKNRWLKKRLTELLPTFHYHVVFTIPHLLNTLALYNKKLIYDLLFEASSSTLKGVQSQSVGVHILILHNINTFIRIQEPGARIQNKQRAPFGAVLYIVF